MSTTALNGTAFVHTAFTAAAPTRTATPRLRMTVRGRRVLMTLSTAPLVIGAAMLVLNGGAATATSDSGSLEYVSVEAGQSLWQIAEIIAPTEDPRTVIDEIVAINGLDSVNIVPGQQLAIPAN